MNISCDNLLVLAGHAKQPNKQCNKSPNVRRRATEWGQAAHESGMTLAEWIRRQCNATVEGSTIAAMVSDAISAQLARGGIGEPPTPPQGFY